MPQSISLCSGSSALDVITTILFRGIISPHDYSIQQYAAVGDDGKNSYEHIKSIVMLSTEDMVNWEYHGIIDTAKTAPWIYNSWAPSIASRVEEDGLTHFYLYFSNNGNGVGIITSTDPVTGCISIHRKGQGQGKN